MKVFISHAAQDDELASRVARGLREEGLEVWDTEVLPGENWAQKVGEALEESDAMVVLLTPDGVRSPHVTHELDFALGRRSYKNRLVSIVAGPPGEIPKDSIPWVLQRMPMIEMTGRDADAEGLRRLARTLREGA